MTDVLTAAAKAIEARDRDRGPAHLTHQTTAKLWSAYLGVPITPRDVCMLNVLQKVARDRMNPACEDNIIDIAGYAANAGALREPAQDGQVSLTMERT